MPNESSPAARVAPPGRRRTAGGVATRERLLGAAERLFAERGFDNVSMPALAEACGITAGAIYKHFQSKERLFFEVVRRAVEAAPAPGAEQAPTSPATFGASVAGFAARRLKLLRLLAVEIHHAAGKHAEVRRLLRSTVDRQIEALAAAIADAQAAGRIDPSLDPRLAASAIMTLIMGLMHMETLTPGLVGDPAWLRFLAERVERMLAPPSAAT